MFSTYLIGISTPLLDTGVLKVGGLSPTSAILTGFAAYTPFAATGRLRGAMFTEFKLD